MPLNVTEQDTAVQSPLPLFQWHSIQAKMPWKHDYISVMLASLVASFSCEWRQDRKDDKILWWEFVDMADLQPVGVLDKLSLEPDPHRFVILPGLEVALACKKLIWDVLTWIQCFNIYIAAVAKEHPDMVPEMLAYMLIVMRAQRE